MSSSSDDEYTYMYNSSSSSDDEYTYMYNSSDPTDPPSDATIYSAGEGTEAPYLVDRMVGLSEIGTILATATSVIRFYDDDHVSLQVIAAIAFFFGWLMQLGALLDSFNKVTFTEQLIEFMYSGDSYNNMNPYAYKLMDGSFQELNDSAKKTASQFKKKHYFVLAIMMLVHIFVALLYIASLADWEGLGDLNKSAKIVATIILPIIAEFAMITDSKNKKSDLDAMAKVLGNETGLTQNPLLQRLSGNPVLAVMGIGGPPVDRGTMIVHALGIEKIYRHTRRNATKPYLVYNDFGGHAVRYRPRSSRA